MPRHTPAPGRPTPSAIALVALCALPADAQQATVLPPVEVIRATPVPGLGVPKDQIPGNVQSASDRSLRDAQSLNLPDFLATRMSSIAVNEVQGNPYQLDVNYRGFSASPLLGAPQGLSVYFDGVRVNEPFGDSVNWDLIPRAALASITLMPGSNPLFGLNTLGGAIALQTKSGLSHRGTQAELSAGSFRRAAAEVAHGRSLGEASHAFVAASAFREDGWRDASPSRVHQLFGKFGSREGALRWDASASLARTSLVGNGATPESMLEQRREAVYTVPDETHNDASLLNVQANYALDDAQSLVATAYLRRVRTDTLNGDLNDAYDPPLVTEAGVENRTQARQRGAGFALQWSRTGTEHRVAAGLSYDRASTDFEQTEAEGDLDSTRRAVPTEAAQINALLQGQTTTRSVFATDTWSLGAGVHVTLSGRYNRTHVVTVDQGRLTLGLPTTLDGNHRYAKFNPAFGLTWRLAPQATMYGGFSQGNRAPSPIELGCSDPANPCVLPNALQSDPPLRQVVARTVEFGVRGNASGVRWNATAFATRNRDDILFISNALAAGYFTNFGRTRRQGFELDAGSAWGPLDWSISYSHLRATFESPACIVSGNNSTEEASPACPGAEEIEVRAGDTIPGLPRHSVKLNASARTFDALRLGAQLAAFSSRYVRGNENNAHVPDGVTFFGSGKVPGYAVLNFTGEWNLAPGWQMFGRIDNVFNRGYATGGLLGTNAFDGAGAVQPPANWRSEQFNTPAAPRSAWIGVRWQLGEGEK
ncbi:MAG: TonB-dependent receptor [Burkholderiaceae bacterium]